MIKGPILNKNKKDQQDIFNVTSKKYFLFFVLSIEVKFKELYKLYYG